MNRYRIVTTQDGKEHISPTVMNHTEAQDFLDIEQDLHESTGWKVTHIDDTLLCKRLTATKKIRRTIQARAFSPLNDKTPNQEFT